ncbi:NAD(P)H-flavin reductase [Prauserella shujinwangii]|uniref:nitric oxide dioxygenase n=1 Tax=Prauserella shujinwangii TaxID=1453103 RepID=A0A2T0LNC7_9PSEU|nr:globin domain-containing protein [Prauserella shujinwangii]PRX44694.1 NAD(P)H-flavin reductase [Prauserella shujinwangii]
MDIPRLRASWNAVASYGGQVPLFFYSTLFLLHPRTREMFPAAMAGQRDKLFTALGHIVAHVDDLENAVPFLQQLGRDHRKFSVAPEHYPAVGQALLATLQHFLGDGWTRELAADWTEAYGLVSQVMNEAAESAATSSPPWWDAEVVAHERRSLDVAVLTVRTATPMPYVPGQSIAVETQLRPRLWRYYSPANAPRPDGRIELHVRLVDGGPVSSALVQAVQVGEVLRLGAPVGHSLTLDHKQDVVFLAGGTGFAPFKALLEQIAEEGLQRRVQLFVGARTAREFYDAEAIRGFERTLPGLRVVPVASDDPGFRGERGRLVDVALRYGPWPEEEVYVCGSPEMVSGTCDALRATGIGPERVHREEFTSYAGTAPELTGSGTADEDHRG